MSMKGKLGPYLTKIRNESGEYEILQLLEQSIDTSNPEKGEVPIKLLGYGEISIVFEILSKDLQGLAFKRLPLFEDKAQVERHIQAYLEYHQLLTEKIGLSIPPQDTAWVYMNEKKSKIALYCIQDKIPSETVINRLLPTITFDQLAPILEKILEELKKVWDFNRTNTDDLEICIDGQISNWALISDAKSKDGIPIPTGVTYIDTSTPLYRKSGEEVMEIGLFMKPAPSFLRWMLKDLAQEVVDRYYSIRDVLTDIIANFYKEQRPDLIPALIEYVNQFLATRMSDYDIEPLNEKEIAKYYKHDKFIWVLYMNLRRFDRFLKTKLFRQKYDFYLPGKIKR